MNTVTSRPRDTGTRNTSGFGLFVKPLGLQLYETINLAKRFKKLFIRRSRSDMLMRSDGGVPIEPAASHRAKRATTPQPWDPTFLSGITPFRPAGAAHRLVFVGELSPLVGTADLQSVAAQWAEGHPAREIEITWVGEGDFRAVLDAQPLPSNMRQRFVGPLSGAALAEVFYRSGLLVVPDFFGRRDAPLREAASAGLPILGSRRNGQMMNAVLHGETGWLFDPLVTGAIFDALDTAMETSVDDLNQMRLEARARFAAQPSEQEFVALLSASSEGGQ